MKINKIKNMIKDLTDLKRCIMNSNNYTHIEKIAEITTINNVILTLKEESDRKKGNMLW